MMKFYFLLKFIIIVIEESEYLFWISWKWIFMNFDTNIFKIKCNKILQKQNVRYKIIVCYFFVT